MNLSHYRYPGIKAALTLNRPPFIPLPKQSAFMESDKPVNILSGAVRAGKSRPLVERALEDAIRYPGGRFGVFRKTRASLRETTLRSFLVDANGWETVDDPAGGYGLIKHWSKSEYKARLYNGSEVLFFGIDKLTKIGSLELTKAYIDEAYELTEADADMIQTRLSFQVGDSIPQVFMATNPGSPHHWLFGRFIKNPDEKTLVERFTTFDNPYLSDEYMETVKRLTGLFYKRMVMGEWVGFAGLIYDCFDADVHVIPSAPPLAKDGFRFRSIDFGGNNPHVCQWWLYNPPRLYLYRELYESGISADELGYKIKQHTPPSESIRYTVADHDVSDRLILRQNHGIKTVAAHKDVLFGIRKTHEKLAAKEMHFIGDALIEPDMKLLDTDGAFPEKRPQSVLDEIYGYEWAVSQGGIAKDEPLKKNDHGMDAMRYAVASIAQPRAKWSSARGI